MFLVNPQLLDRLRISKGLSRSELASMVKKADGGTPSRQLISYYLDGKRRTASKEIAESLAAAVGADFDALWADFDALPVSPVMPSRGERTPPDMYSAVRMARRASRRTSVYLAYDADGVLIYVGCSANVATRIKDHVLGSKWWHFAATMSVEHYPNLREARSRERELIELHRPPFNRDGNPEYARKFWQYVLVNPAAHPLYGLPNGPADDVTATKLAELQLTQDDLAADPSRVIDMQALH